MLRTITDAEYAACKTAFAILVIGTRDKVRFKRLPNGFRLVCSDTPAARASAAQVLNLNGYRHASGKPFDRFSIDGNQFFVRYREV